MQRDAAGVSQAELAQRANIHRAYMARIESDGLGVTVLRLYAVADALRNCPRTSARLKDAP